MLKLVFALICALLIAVFAVQNAKAVAVAFLVWRFETSLVLIILGAAALSAVAVFLFGTLRVVQQGRTVREATKRIQQLESELERLQVKTEGQNMKEVPTEDRERNNCQ
jgi:putative membrane protein